MHRAGRGDVRAMKDGRTTHDVAIIGGGPGGSTVASFLKLYNPDLRVVVFEKERFPREHVGESQLPVVGHILDEIGVWDKVERANFPIKIGATYLWGSSPQPWNFEFLPLSQFRDQPRPAKFEEDRRLTAWQVDRAVYDKILLDHARELGAEVHEQTRVAVIPGDDDHVAALETDNGERITATHYIDASGHIGVLRRAMGVGRTVPTSLKNMAVWDYWENAQWATTIGTGGTRVQVLSIGSGWIWFIPISPTRTSIGFICPASHYKKKGMSPEELYVDALSQCPRVMALTADATRETPVRTTTDWSFLADRMVGSNWMLVGESAGFADPVLAGGLALTHVGARAASYMILSLERGEHDRAWLADWYTKSQQRQIKQFIRFADFWYAANGQFTDLQDISADIAKDAGIKLTAKEAFRWLSLGGFNPEDGSRPGIGGLDFGAVHEITGKFVDQPDAPWSISKYNTFKLNLVGARKTKVPLLKDGRIEARDAYTRGGRTLPLLGVYAVVHDVLKSTPNDMESIAQAIVDFAARIPWLQAHDAMATLETMLIDGWVRGSVDKRRPVRPYLPHGPEGRSNFNANQDDIPEIVTPDRGAAPTAEPPKPGRGAEDPTPRKMPKR